MFAKKFLTLAEAAELARVPRKTVEHWIYSGQLPATQRGKHRLVREELLVRWLEGEDVRGQLARGR
jgi:excisionase family DNA binding protein